MGQSLSGLCPQKVSLRSQRVWPWPKLPGLGRCWYVGPDLEDPLGIGCVGQGWAGEHGLPEVPEEAEGGEGWLQE